MKRILLSVVALTLVIGAIGLSSGARKEEIQIDKEARNPWTHLRWNNDPDTFHFAVVSDRTGGHRARVFSQAVDQLNLLQPSFVVSVGDLIEGYSKDPKVLGQEWKELQSYVNKLQMPFFYVPGNHDLANAVEVNEWTERFGRRYYHFTYRDVLFLAVCTDDKGEDKGYGAISKEQTDYFANVLKAKSKSSSKAANTPSSPATCTASRSSCATA
jgi:predicted MPP superfamily phosphohydrolase